MKELKRIAQRDGLTGLHTFADDHSEVGDLVTSRGASFTNEGADYHAAGLSMA